MPSFFSEGNTPKFRDTRWRSLEKILGATIDIGGGGGVGVSYVAVYDNQAALPAAPPDPTKVYLARFRDGSAGMTWDNVNLVWF